MNLELLVYGLPALFVIGTIGGFIALGIYARTEPQATRWAGYVFLAGFILMFAFSLVIAAVSD